MRGRRYLTPGAGRRPMRGLALALVGVALVATVAGCLDGGSRASAKAADLTGDPYPVGHGAEWPLGLKGPFSLLSAEHQQLTASDEMILDGWIVRPDVPDGVKVPVVLW